MMRSDTSGGISVVGIIVVFYRRTLLVLGRHKVPGDSFDKQFLSDIWVQLALYICQEVSAACLISY
jgi:hypothetical protein